MLGTGRCVEGSPATRPGFFPFCFYRLLNYPLPCTSTKCIRLPIGLAGWIKLEGALAEPGKYDLACHATTDETESIAELLEEVTTLGLAV